MDKLLGIAESVWVFIFGGTIDTVTYTGKFQALGDAILANPLMSLGVGITLVGLVFGLFGRGMSAVKG